MADNITIGGVPYQRVMVSFCEGTDCAQNVSTDHPLPVAVISGGGGSSGGLTNTELRASAVPVSGAFYPATQPVSGTVSVSGSVAVTGSFYQATQPVSIASMPTTPVTGTFWQATQPVSIASMPSTPVTGTFWQATQPVSGTVTANAGSGTFAVSGTFWQATQPVSIAATVATRDLKDNGRTLFSAATVIGGVAAVTTEALLSMVPTRAGVAGSAATTIQATNGKTLRITAIVFGTRSTSAAVISGRCALRMNPSGAVTASSPIIAIASATQQAAALAEAGDTCVVPIPDGIEISGTQNIGLSQVCSATTGVVYATLVGFEY